MASAAKEIDNRLVPTGEIDFLVLHQNLGILAIEVKGGILTYNGTEFVLKRTGEKIDPTRQVIRGSFALRKLLSNSGVINRQIGYCLLFPESEMGDNIPIALIDLSIQPPQRIVFDMSHLGNLGTHIQEVMIYWQKSLGTTWKIKKQQFEELIDVLVPRADYTPSWQTRINNDIVTWLQLTPEQTGCLNKIAQENRMVVRGFPGTGKTLLLVEHVRRLSKLRKKVLIITYNVLLARRLQEELSNTLAEVYTFHEQCRQAGKLTGNSNPMLDSSSNPEANREWYSITAPNLLQQALDEQKLPSYDSLVVDEGQVLDISWWQTLAQWFMGKQIIAFCDSTQVFSFENSVSPLEIAEIIGSKSPYALTINLRSPKAVFERVTQVKSEEYQQYCPRPIDTDTLEEVVVEDTSNILNEIIERLGKEGAKKESIVIITAYGTSKNKEFAGIKIVSASKFRGLESPVVIVLTGGGSDETSLFCAYTRATSRCIVIYNALQVINGNYGAFGQILLDLDTTGNIQKEADSGLTSVIFEQQRFNLIPVADKTINLYWCSDWSGWVIPPGEFDRVAQSMWTYHLVVTTNHPVYSWDLHDRGKLNYFRSSQPLDDYFRKNCCLWHCEACEITTPFTIIDTEIGECTICCRENNTFSTYESNPNFDLILEPDPKSSALEKKKLSIFLIALGIWNTIDEKQKQSFYSEVIAGGTIAYQVALLLVLTDLIRNRDLILKRNEIAKKHLLWCPDLAERIDNRSWEDIVQRALNRWAIVGYISKIEKGVYQKTKNLKTHQLKYK